MSERFAARTAAEKVSSGIGRFRNDAARVTFMDAYDGALAAWPAPPEHLDVETRFGTTHVLRCGPPAGTPIVLLHAVAVASPAWFANVAALSEHHPVFALDTITDAGRSSQTMPVRNAEEMAQWLDDALAALALEKIHLVGLSYGAWLALNQARYSAGRLASVTATDPPGAIVRMKFDVKMLPDGFLAKFARSDAALSRLIRMLNNGKLPPAPIVDLSVAGLRTFRLEQPFPRRLRDAQLQAITTPVLLLVGECSSVTDAERAVDRARRLLPDVEAEIFPGAGHMLPVDQPDGFNARVLRFVEGVERRRA